MRTLEVCEIDRVAGGAIGGGHLPGGVPLLSPGSGHSAPKMHTEHSGSGGSLGSQFANHVCTAPYQAVGGIWGAAAGAAVGAGLGTLACVLASPITGGASGIAAASGACWRGGAVAGGVAGSFLGEFIGGVVGNRYCPGR
jgi:hypothetical protein